MNFEKYFSLIGNVAILLGINLITTDRALAVIYNIDRSWDDGNASLVGTVEIPEGTYYINSAIFDPFLDIDLLLSYNDSSTVLDRVNFSDIQNSGTFIIDAGLSNIVFETQNADGLNPAILSFTNISGDSYSIGSDRNPGFESSFFNGFSSSSVSFPNNFASVPSAAVPFEFSPSWGFLLLGSLWGSNYLFRHKN